MRLKHILPVNSSVLHMAYQRGLLQRPFPFDVLDIEKTPNKVIYWVRNMRHNSEYMCPRLFMPYFYEVKVGVCIVFSSYILGSLYYGQCSIMQQI